MKLKLVKKIDEAKGTKSFFWEPEKAVSYQPGQYFYYTIPSLKYPDPRGTTRHFTNSASPTEGNLLRITTRIRDESGYKKSLDELPIGSEVDGEGPNGTFVLDEKDTGAHIFIAGGIGITPFRSMIKYAADKNLSVPIYLIYSNSDGDFVFGQELKEINSKSNLIKIEFYDSSKSGHLDELKIKKFIENWKLVIGNCTFWLCGPPQMVDAMEQLIGKLGVSVDRVFTEKFTGY